MYSLSYLVPESNLERFTLFPTYTYMYVEEKATVEYSFYKLKSEQFDFRIICTRC